MAIWQFEVMLVPVRKIRRLYGRVPQAIPEEGWEAGDWWGGELLSDADQRFVGSRLPERAAWTAELSGWGTEDGNRVDIYVAGRRIVEASVRIDARMVDVSFVDFVAELAERWNCVLVTPELQIVPPLRTEILAAVSDSHARRFVLNPDRVGGEWETGHG